MNKKEFALKEHEKWHGKLALDVHARNINDEMKLAAAEAIANVIPENEITPEYIIPNAFNPSVKEAVASAVKAAARKTGVARI